MTIAEEYAKPIVDIVKSYLGNVHAPQVDSVRMFDIIRRPCVDKKTQIELEAATLRRLLAHLQEHSEVQNIDLMIVADFCRNCLAKWYLAEAAMLSVDLDYEQAREIIYGMPYSEWKDKYQLEATPEQLAAYQERQQ
jgi:hypothetical protein